MVFVVYFFIWAFVRWERAVLFALTVLCVVSCALCVCVCVLMYDGTDDDDDVPMMIMMVMPLTMMMMPVMTVVKTMTQGPRWPQAVAETHGSSQRGGRRSPRRPEL